MPKLSQIFVHPIKSFSGISLDTIALSKGEGLPNDRRFAITNGISNTMEGAWLTCRSFFINAVNEGLLKFAVDMDGDTIRLKSPEGLTLSLRLGDPEGLAIANRRLADFVSSLNPKADMPMPVITERSQTQGALSGYWDFNDSGISFMNAASLKAISNAMGEDLDIRRLRGNLIIEDLPAWEEFSWIGKSIRIGTNGPELDILRPVKRCPASSVNPATGIRDVKVPDALMDHFGHAFCGIYAKVTKPGHINTDDTIEVIGDAKTPLVEAANPADSDYKLWPKLAEVISFEHFPSSFEAPLRSTPQDEGSSAIRDRDSNTPQEQANRAAMDHGNSAIYESGHDSSINDPHPEVRSPELVEGRVSKGEGCIISIKSAGPWPLPQANNGQRVRFHIAQDLIGVAIVHEQLDHATVLHVEPSATNDPATAYLLEKVKAGDRLIVSGPFGRG